MSISAVSGNTSVTSTSSSSSSTTTLSSATQAKLKALGLNPSDYKSETEAQTAITKANAEKEAQASQKTQAGKSNTTEQSIKDEATSLAAQLGVQVSGQDSIDDIVNNMQEAISSLKSTAGTDATKLAQVDTYQSQLTAISNSYSNYEISQNAGASAMASYNKAYYGLT